MKKLSLFTILLLFTIASYSQAFLKSPIEGRQGKEWIIVNYVDWDTSGFKDHNCGSKSYDGHQGTDYTIQSFKQMDEGVKVFAAASGRVTFTKDGEFDRETEGDITKLLGNYIAIKHPNKYYTYYGHLRKNSIIVSEGDTVTAGDLIGYIGSSGNSTDPHLHFEVWYDSLYVVDPFQGTCGNSSTLFIDPPEYDTSQNIWDGGIQLRTNLTINDLRERILTVERPQIITPSSDSSLYFWVHTYGMRAGKELKLVWYEPDGTEWFSNTITLDKDYWYYYYLSFINHTDLPEGLWNIELLYDGNLLIEDQFEVSKTASVSANNAEQNCSAYNATRLKDLQRNPNLEISLTDVQGRELDTNKPYQTGLYLITIKHESEVCVMKRMGSF